MKKKLNLIKTMCHRAHKICSPELFSNEISQIIFLFKKKRLPAIVGLVNITISNNLKNLNKRKLFEP